MNRHFKFINEQIKKEIIDSNGDIFQMFIGIYDFMDDNCSHKEDMEFYKKIFENIKASDDYKISKEIINRPNETKDYYKYINTENLKANSKEDIEIIEKILFTITIKAIVMRFSYESKEKAKEEYLKQIDYLKYGMVRKEGTIC